MSVEMKTITINGVTYEIVDEQSRNRIVPIEKGGTGATTVEQARANLGIIPDDWSQDDKNAPDYVKNRTHWVAPRVLLPEEVVPGNEDSDLWPIADVSIGEDEELFIVVDGVTYRELSWENDDGDFCWGDSRIHGSDVHPSDTPCVLLGLYDEITMVPILTCTFRDTSKSHTIEIKSTYEVEFHPLSINLGGTGATTAKEARSRLGAAPAYTYGTEDLTAGTSELATGTLHFVYE